MEDLKHKFEGFGKDPSPEVWEKISASLDAAPGGSSFGKTKGLLTLLAFAACLGIGFYAWTSNFGTKTNATIADKSNIETSGKTKRNISPDEADKRNTTFQEKENITEKESINTPDNNSKNSRNNSLKKIAVSPENKNNSEENSKGNIHLNTFDKEKVSKTVVAANSDEPIHPNSTAIPLATSTKSTVNTLSENTNIHDIAADTEQESIQVSQRNIVIPSIGTITNQLFVNNNKDLSFIDPKPSSLPATEIEYSKLTPCLYVIQNKKKWQHTLVYRQGMISYENNPPANTVSTVESFSAAPYTTNQRPYSLTYEMSRKFSPKSGYTFLAGYQRDKSIHSQSSIELYAINTNSVLLGGGYQVDLLRKRRWTITPGTVLFGIGSFKKRVNARNDNAHSVEFLLDTTEDTDIRNTFEPAIKAELNIAVDYALTEKVSITLMPFFQRSFLKHPGLGSYAKPNQWGIGLGMKF